MTNLIGTEFILKVNRLLQQLNGKGKRGSSLLVGIELANEFMRLFGVPAAELKSGDDVLDNAFENSKFKNQKMEAWFEKHPYLGNARIALYHYKGSLPVESYFYQLNESASKSKISATTQLSSNWEDSKLTMLPEYRVGVDFFLDSDGNSLKFVVTNQGNLRVLELSDKLSNTQIEILCSLKDCFLYSGVDNDTGRPIPFEPQRTIHRTLWNALALQQVNKKFYTGISDHFVSLYSHIEAFPPKEIDLGRLKYESKLFSSRLIGRLLFLWFLRKRNIFNEEFRYFDTVGLNSNDYYQTKLKVLFFSVLNTSVEQRVVHDKRTPYLNGGLFEPHINDWVHSIVQFPENWFDSLFEHFNRFNFTTDESTPSYEQVAIDPEMLGRVFENLLASLRPETKDAANERNNKGAFYTPRDIVSFMNKEVLKGYLKTYLGNEKDSSGVDSLIDMNDAQFIEQKSTGSSELWGKRTEEVRGKIIDALSKVKILDPACGSGAFPIGILQLIIQTYERLYAIYDHKTGSIRCALPNENPDNYSIKLHVLRNNLYGIDIEPMAIEIARLRSWLSLIIDDKKEIDPLPNLDFNFVCANSLVPLNKGTLIISFNDFDYDSSFEIIKEEYFNAHSKTQKDLLRERFKSLYKLIRDEYVSSERTKKLLSWDPFNSNSPSAFFDPKTMFNCEKFHIVVGNPPYIHLEDIKEDSKNLYKPLGYSTYEARGDIYALFYEMGVKSLDDNGFLCFITSNKFLTAGYGEKLRRFMVEKTNPIALIDLGSGVFESAAVDTCILITQKAKYEGATSAISISNNDNRNGLIGSFKSLSTTISLESVGVWKVLTEVEQSIKRKIEMKGTLLKNIDNIRISYGIKTGLNEAFIINEETRSYILNSCTSVMERQSTDSIIKKILRGRDIGRNQYNWNGQYLILMHNGYVTDDNKSVDRMSIENYPSLKKYLEKYFDKLKKRTDQGSTPYNLRDCAYIEDFAKPKIIWSDISSEPNFALVNEEIFINNTAYMITGFPEWLLDFLNSAIVEWYFPLIASSLGDTGVRYFKQFVENIPIPESFDVSKPFENYNFTSEELMVLTNGKFKEARNETKTD